MKQNKQQISIVSCTPSYLYVEWTNLYLQKITTNTYCIETIYEDVIC